MADLEKLEADPKGQLFEHLADVRAVMLGSPDHTQPMQPMDAQVDAEGQRVWFYASRSSDLVRALEAGPADVQLCTIEDDYQASVRGTLRERFDETIRDRFWSPTVAAWFEGGKADPNLTLLCFTPKEAAIWAERRNPVRFAYEIAQANIKDHTPDVGERERVSF